MVNDEQIDFCKPVLDRVIGKKTFELKMRYQLETFFFHEGWASMTNPKNGKDGYTSQHTYNDDTIKHFIEDMVRWSRYEFDKKFNKKTVIKTEKAFK